MEAALLSSFLNTYLPKIWDQMTKGEKEKKQKRLQHKFDIELLEQEFTMMAATIQDYESSGMEDMDSRQTAWISESRRLAQQIEDHIELVLHSGDSSVWTIMETDNLMKRLKSINKVPTSQVGHSVPCLPDQFITDLPEHIEHEKEPLEELLELVQEPKEPQKEARKMKVIAIVGFGGLGKTLRAQQVYESPEVDSPEFRPRVWVRAGGMSADNILKEIRKRLEEQDDGASSSSAGQQHITDLQRIKRYLQDKRYFIVIDDMREEEQWQDIEDAFPRKLSSRIIVTTAIQSVARTCCRSSGGYVYKLQPLSEGQSVNLLVNKLDCISPEDVADHAVELLKICEGLPLALISLSRYFQSDGLTRETCEVAYRELGAYLMGEKKGLEKIRKVLADIYTALDRPEQRRENNGLDRHILKACLLYFSMFLDNHQTTRNHLIRRWVAEGFGSQDHATKNFKILMERNVIQAMEVSRDGHGKKCQPPGMMLKYILYKATSENFVTKSPAEMQTNGFINGFKTSEKSKIYARRLCVNLDSLQDGKCLDHITLPVVRTLQVSGEASTEILKFQNRTADDYKLLRILELKGCAALTNKEVENICDHLLLLRYLSLQGVGAKMDRIPRRIANLKLLETLHVGRTEAVIVPFELILLPYLTHLLGKFQFYDASEYKNIPSESKIKLERLSGFVAGEKGFPELMPRMNCLRKVKIWCNRSADGTLSEAIKTFIRIGLRDNGYRSLSVDFSGYSTPFKDSDNYPGRLTSLKLKGKIMMERFPQFLDLSGVEKLCLSSTQLTWVLIEEGVGQFPRLIYLKLYEDDLHDLAPAPEDDAPKDALSVGQVKPFQKLQRICFSAKTHLPPPTILQRRHYLPAIKEVYLHSIQTLDEETRCSWKLAARKHPQRPMVWFGAPTQAS